MPAATAPPPTMKVSAATAQPEIDVDAVLAQLSLNEKVALLSGIDGWHTAAIPRLGVPSVAGCGRT